MATVPDLVVKLRVEANILDEAQIARVEALIAARRVLMSQPGMFGTRELSVVDLHALAVFILDGGDLPTESGSWVRGFRDELADIEAIGAGVNLEQHGGDDGTDAH